MKYLLDTNICIALIKDQDEHIIKKIDSNALGESVISTITVHELEFGIANSAKKDKNKSALQNLLLAKIPCVEFDMQAAEVSGQIRAELKQKGKPIGPYDVLIAGHALTLGLTLVTRNVKEFSRVKDLSIEKW